MTGLRIVLWTTFCAPFVDARNATRAQALLLRAVGLFVFPLAYAWYFLFRPKKDSAVASLQDVPATVSCDWNLVGQEWVVSRRFAALRAPETSRPFSWVALAGQACIVVVVPHPEEGISLDSEEHLQDLEKVLDLAPGGVNVTVVCVPSSQPRPGTGAAARADKERASPAATRDFREYVAFRGAGLVFTEPEIVNGPNEAPLFSFLKEASGNPLPIGRPWTKFLVLEDGTTVKRFGSRTRSGEIIGALWAGHDAAARWWSADWESSRRWQRVIASALKSQLALAVALASASTALYLYPASAASASSRSSTSAVDGAIIACAAVLLLDTAGRALDYQSRWGGLLGICVELFCVGSLCLDVSFLKGTWAEAQTSKRILIAIRAARVARVLRLWYLVQSWRRVADPVRTTRTKSAKGLARDALDASTLQVGIIIVLSVVLAAPYLAFSGFDDEVATAVEMFSDSLRYTNSPPLSPSPSSSGGTTTGAGPPQPYYAQGTQGNAPPGAQPPKPPMMASIRAFAADFCLLRFAEVAPHSLSYGAETALCPGAKQSPSSALGTSTKGARLFLASRAVGGVTVTLDVSRLQQQEGLATVSLICFCIAGIVLLSLSLADAVEQQVVRPMDRMWSALSVKTSEAYGSMQQTGSFSGPEAESLPKDTFDRMIHQLSYMALSYRVLATQDRAGGGQGNAMDRYLRMEGMADPLTRQWVLGQAGLDASASMVGFVQPTPQSASRQSGGQGASNSAAPSPRPSDTIGFFPALLGKKGVFPSPGSRNSVGKPPERASTTGLGMITPWVFSPRGTGGAELAPAQQSTGSSLLLDDPGRQSTGANGSAEASVSAGEQRSGGDTARPSEGPGGGVTKSMTFVGEGLARAQSMMASLPAIIGARAGRRKSTESSGIRSPFATGDSANTSASVHGGAAHSPPRGGESTKPQQPKALASASASTVDPFRWSAKIELTGSPWEAPCSVSEADLASWEFDIFTVDSQAFAIFGTLGVFRHGFCYKGTLWALIVECSQLYRPNPFHNFRHAVDILHTTSLLLKAVEKRQLFAPLEVFAVAVAALAHDLDHPGVTNAFLVNTSEPLAIEYNDAAVLEQHHLATLFRLMQANPIANVFSRCNRDAYKSVRKVILETVQHTDMSKHFGMVSKARPGCPWMGPGLLPPQAEMYAQVHREDLTFSARGDEEACERLKASTEDRMFLLSLILHCADISNPTKTKSVQDKWAVCVNEEFFAQGDREAQLGLPVSPGFDRKTATLPMSQINFCEFIVMPLFASLVAIFPELAHTVSHARSNYHAYIDEELSSGIKTPEQAATLEKRRGALERKAAQTLLQAARGAGPFPEAGHPHETDPVSPRLRVGTGRRNSMLAIFPAPASETPRFGVSGGRQQHPLDLPPSESSARAGQSSSRRRQSVPSLLSPPRLSAVVVAPPVDTTPPPPQQTSFNTTRGLLARVLGGSGSSGRAEN